MSADTEMLTGGSVAGGRSQADDETSPRGGLLPSATIGPPTDRAARIVRQIHWTPRPLWSTIWARPTETRSWTLASGPRGLGVGQYETTFNENGVDAEVLPDLTDADSSKSSACRSATASGF